MTFSVDDIQSLGLSAVEAQKPKRQELGQEQFLKLMTTQLTHQDPSKPMENGQFLAEMAQFSTVEGIGSLNNAFADFASSMTSKQALEASGMVGKSVAFPTNTGVLSIEDSLRGNVNLPASTQNLSINILDGNGTVVKNLNLGSQSSGFVKFEWDGQLDDGSYAVPGAYQVQAQAHIDGQNTALETLMSGKVESVDLSNPSKGIVLNLDQMGSVAFSKVKQVF